MNLQGLLHYDMITRSQPGWRLAIEEACQGRFQRLESVMLAIRTTMPVQANFVVASLKYLAEGRQVFCVGPRLQKMLHETGVENIPQGSLKLPYSCFYVAFPDCDWRLWGGSTTGMHQIAGAYLYDDGAQGLGILVWGKANEKSVAEDDDASFSMCLGIPEIPIQKDDPTCYDIELYLEKLLTNPASEQSDIGFGLFDIPQRNRKSTTRAFVRSFESF